MNKTPPTPTAGHAFTLIELLTAIAIVAILTTITIPAISRARRAAEDVQCKSALRQWGGAMQMYVSDNDGFLPGPCWAVVQNVGSNKRQMTVLLTPYLGVPIRSGDPVPDEYFCHSWAREKTLNTAPVWQLNRRVTKTKGGNIQPFGYPNEVDPMSWAAVGEQVDISKAKALSDIDLGLASTAGLPPQPVHGKHRNVLFLDWHVDSQQVN